MVVSLTVICFDPPQAGTAAASTVAPLAWVAEPAMPPAATASWRALDEQSASTDQLPVVAVVVRATTLEAVALSVRFSTIETAACCTASPPDSTRPSSPSSDPPPPPQPAISSEAASAVGRQVYFA
ncbi:hypothetical protein C1702_04100 [Caldimonas thermodepolymerans]|uniref:Uncharacterized protein n=1 Tax=Caldimonas thermodepolymerans TaxID=215580 RepID=A0A2S5T857_9BURK|nr:hypothetical protein C1702_04100 [Caldimonas thermodepolymerans]